MDAALEHLFHGSARGLYAALQLLEHELSLAFDRRVDDLTGLGVEEGKPDT